MKFDEKLITLRKKKMLSQEQLAEELNVTRQTISKWELGQSKPDMDKLTAMSRLFNVSIDTLTNDDMSLLEEDTTIKKVKNKPSVGRKIVLYILIFIFIGSLATLVVRVGKSFKAIGTNSRNRVINLYKDAKKEIDNMSDDDFDSSFFNAPFETYGGTQRKYTLSLLIDNIVTNNKKNKNHLIEVVYDEKNYGTDAESIRGIKKSLKDGEYEISFDYDNDKYIKKATIESN